MVLSTRAARAAVFTLACALTALLYAPRLGRWYTPDSFALHALGDRWWQGEGYTTQAARDLYLATPDATQALPSRSFPPLLPALTGAINQVADLGVGAGVLVGAACAAGLYAMAALAPLTAAPYPVQCLTLFLFMILNAGFVAELIGGRTVPLAALLLVLTVHVGLTLRNRPRLRRAVALGLLLAASMLNRFDAAPVALGLPILLWALPGQPGIQRAGLRRALALAYGVMIATYLPWAARNWQLFHTPFASDNAITALALASEQGLAYPRAAVRLLWDAPGTWAWQRLGFLARNLVSVAIHPRSLCLWPLLLLPVLRARAYALRTRQHALLALGILALNLLTVSLTPYPDLRYFSAATCVVWSVYPALLPRESLWAPRRLWVGASATALVAILAVGAMRFDGGPWGLAPCTEECVRYSEAARAFAPWLSGRDAGRVASRFPDTLAHYTGWRTVALPYREPGDGSDYAAWLRDWQPRYAVIEGNATPPMSRAVARSPQGLTLVQFAL